jgi:hypothetical protein
METARLGLIGEFQMYPLSARASDGDLLSAERKISAEVFSEYKSTMLIEKSRDALGVDEGISLTGGSS